jgi:hypothetical protein
MSLIICDFAKYYYVDQIKNDEMGGACSTYGRDENWIQIFSRRTELREQLEDLEDNIRMEHQVV